LLKQKKNILPSENNIRRNCCCSKSLRSRDFIFLSDFKTPTCAFLNFRAFWGGHPVSNEKFPINSYKKKLNQNKMSTNWVVYRWPIEWWKECLKSFRVLITPGATNTILSSQLRFVDGH
jgi:hypothetical protein